MRLIILLLIITTFSCAKNSPDLGYYEEGVDYRNKAAETKTHAGSTCNNNCIWSTYAVTNMVQTSTKQCEEGPCACVMLGNANLSCEIKPNEILEDDIQINNMPSGIKNLPYFNQYYNEKYGYATCQNTSIAMVLSYYEKSFYIDNIHPDTIYKQWGKDYAQSPSGLNSVYSSYAKNSHISTYISAAPEDLVNALEAGYVAIVHGYFTNFGHVLVVRGYKDGRYYVNDPAGRWEECFKCGYNNTNDLDGVTSYSEAVFNSAVFTSDGYNYLPGWIHLIKPM